MSVEIESEDIIRLILQFFDEQHLGKALNALESETSIKLNTVANKDDFTQEIIQGKWDLVLNKVVTLNIRPKALIDLYEQVILELAELRELGAARSLLRQSHPMYLLKQQHPERYLHLEHVLSRTFFDAKDAYPKNMTKEKRRQVIAQELANEVSVASPSRLMTLLEQSAQWQCQQGLSTLNTFDVFGGGNHNGNDGENAIKKTDVTPMEEDDHHDQFAGTQHKTIKFPGKTAYAECMAFSSDGQFFITGSVDGFMEIWNPEKGKLRKDIRYQAEGNLMAMDESIICLAFDKFNETLVSGSTDGKIAAWRIQSGTCRRRISPAHSQGVTSVQLNKDATHILSGSYDQLIKIHSIKSGKLIKEFKGHTSFINSIMYINNDSNILSASSDGTIKLWNVESTECLSTIRPTEDTTPIQLILPLPSSMDQLFAVCNKTRKLSIYSYDGSLVKVFPLSGSDEETQINSDFIGAALSRRGEIIYGITESGKIYGFDMSTGKLIGHVQLPYTEIISMASHPSSDMLAVNDAAGHIYLLKP
ncbi:WD40-repeat-containing domain protein [Halteromyces radiatus]|uniref:WD40-repeat-containing domain protein n=1 Tax=Halteromyces radiatus TaxID=101107 RepID=UPI002220F689|nr:WD40-repeat-containing domain protein [Halteromyces radiatus]KAI8082880.1 WD40-repeat-containing domain protein [Halteromyces radiatus]